ncbi:MAG TPA: 6-hydroxycyclohex-1-ene-1-carbonyl-CoA dehydrogenase [Vicinamibacterales bacterium]|nr:6-hydroxycyclohex-1-ene-1-carbonyl-CoA dehydrogenase [Vicinamibacterales bacterium]
MEYPSAYGFFFEGPGHPLIRRPMPALAPAAGEVVIEVSGCGICHTDVGFAVDGVPTRHPPPIVLGHEISGRVVDTGAGAAEWRDAAVIVPSVIPCGACPACCAGRPTICRRQFMPGNDGHGGFATHVKVPARGLCRVPDQLRPGLPLSWLSVIADAVTTPYEAIRRSRLTEDHVAVFVGVGGVGGFGVQIAAALGAAVAAIDVDGARLALAARHGATLTINSSESDVRSTRAAIRAFAQDSGRSGLGLRIFETSGTPAGQQTAFNLLDFGAHLAVVGYTPKPVELKLSNLMAFDATAAGNWGCPPDRYPEVLELVLGGGVSLDDYVEVHALDCAPNVFQRVVEHKLTRRAILTPTQ